MKKNRTRGKNEKEDAEVDVWNLLASTEAKGLKEIKEVKGVVKGCGVSGVGGSTSCSN